MSLTEKVGHQLWTHLKPEGYPFLDFNFINALEKSQSTGELSGWDPLSPRIIKDRQGIPLLYQKQHSYGEYIFDWEWAHAYQANGLPYYPKLVSMVPFTPATCPHFLMPEFDEKIAVELCRETEELVCKEELSSVHYLFITTPEKQLFESLGYIMRASLQYHYFNENYQGFDDFLSALKQKRAKQIRKERRSVSHLDISNITADALKEEHADEMYQFYLSTIRQKSAMDYLKADFFKMVFRTMKDQVLYIRSCRGGRPVAGSLFFYDNTRLYGRYWGCVEEINHLHFEMCYYRGMEFCIKNKLQVFEAGAQGEHKIPRGFKPVYTWSAHKIRHEGFSKAIGDFVVQEKKAMGEFKSKLEQALPFK